MHTLLIFFPTYLVLGVFQDSSVEDTKLKCVSTPSVSITLAAALGSFAPSTVNSNSTNGPRLKMEEPSSNSSHVDSSSSPSNGFTTEDRLHIAENGKL